MSAEAVSTARPRAKPTSEFGLPSIVVRTATAAAFFRSDECGQICREIEARFPDYFPAKHFTRRRLALTGIRIVPWRSRRWLTVYGVRGGEIPAGLAGEIQLSWDNPVHAPIVQYVTRRLQIAYRQHLLDTYSPWADGSIVQESIFNYGARGRLKSATDEVPSLKHARREYEMNAKELKAQLEKKREENATAGWRASAIEQGAPQVVALIGQEIGETEKDGEDGPFTIYHFPARHVGEGAADETFDVTAGTLAEELAGFAADGDASPTNPVFVKIGRQRQGKYLGYSAVVVTAEQAQAWKAAQE